MTIDARGATRADGDEPNGDHADVGDALVPPRPLRGSGIELVGEMKETGFARSQWLIQRDGRFIQLSELLYRVLEKADGRHTLDDIARHLTDQTRWHVTADHVRELIGTKLVPAGLIASGDGLPRGESYPGAPRSPLAVNMRVKLVGPTVLDPVTRFLKELFRPPVLVCLLALVALAHAWLYLGRGAIDVVTAVLYQPAIMLVALPIVLLAAVFHEFGHASALRYGGGRARRMGAGFYLIYPALFTDVTDAYRLGRWARVRTALGGVYFHLLFSAGLVGLAMLSGWDVLMFAVIIINLDVLRQFIPFVRLDGYWVLADLSGIPDFFSQMGPFLRSLLPDRWKGGPALPELKPWVRRVFALYVFVTVPMLLVLFVAMARRVPLIVSTAFDSIRMQATFLTSAVDAADWAAVTAAAGHMAVLALPVIGIAYVTFSLVRSVVWFGFARRAARVSERR